MSQTTLQTLLGDARLAGVYHLPESGRLAVRQAAEAVGLACFEIDFHDAQRIDVALAELASALDFPAWYGNNFDALKDCLTDFSWCEAAGYVLIVAHAENLHAKAPAAFQLLNQVFAAAIGEWQAQEVPLWVFYDLRADGLATLPTLT
ncbi:barstar family protein [Accumulibacter sp.]|uniref:barstar family protein n=1 Tax=Accumulibacter sp. TaxID=2053492 RepID=UPI0026303F4B|nr:barstar family protein [Accumulibacter sp.]